MRSRLKEAEARLAEELRCREALEQDVLSHQSVVQQLKIDQRIAEKRSTRQTSGHQNGDAGKCISYTYKCHYATPMF